MINVSQNRWLNLLAGLGVGACSATVGASPYDIADKPLFLSVSVPPNVALTLDDSGSMTWGAAPDNIAAWGYNNETVKNSRRWKSSAFNPIYYDPETDYVRPVNDVNSPLPTSFTAAYFNGFDTSRGTVNLSTSYRPMDVYDPSYATGGQDDTHRHFVQNPSADYYSYNNYDYRTTGVPAYYYTYDSAKFGISGCPGGGSKNDDDCYTRVVVSATSGPGGSDERQNFANWYSFYRTRNLATVSAASLAFSQLGGETRVAWQNLHTCDGFDQACSGWTSSTYDSRIAKFDGSHRQNFYNWLFRLPAWGGTPLRSSLMRAGEMFKTDRPYHDDPGANSNFGPVCRQNYSIVMTDGIWNTDNPSIGNTDNGTRALPDGVTYTPRAPFKDSNSNSLADLAFEYWATDLRSDLSDSPALKNEPISGDETIEYDDPNITGDANASATLTKYWNPKNDPASWQHMVNFVVGVGLSGWLTEPNLAWDGDTYAGGYNALATGHAAWPATGSDTVPGNVYDLWHAALNSRGQFFSAESPKDVVTAFRSIIQRIQARLGSASNLALNAGSVSSSSQLFQAVFDSADWSGHLLARPFSNGQGNMTCTNNEPRGAVCPPVWDAGCGLTGGLCPATGTTQTAQDWNTGRTILTYDGSLGKPFRWNDLTAAQQAALSAGNADPAGQDRLNYLRGDRSKEEQNGGSYRNRLTLLGDIVHSTPAYVGAPEKEYPVGAWVDKLGGSVPESDYGSFLSGYATRQHVVYAGANDGLLHGFRAGHFDNNGAYQSSDNDGREVLAYVPSQVFPELARLTDPTYRSAGLHKYFVDGELEATDAYFNGNWHTVLVGGLGAGGQGIFALDITDPAGFSEASAANTLLWEFTDAYDDGTYTGDDLGFTYGQPHVVRLHNGKWGVLVGNGYNNTVNVSLTDVNVSATGNAVLYILDVENGAVMAKLDTGEGAAAAHSGGRPNGLATVTPIDLDGDVVTDYVYAGDLYGNVWRFDLTATSAGSWKVSDYGAGGPTPLLVAEDANSPSKRQPITTRVLADVHPRGLSYGVMVYAGTGKYFEEGDNAADTTTNHSVYGVWDAHFTPFSSVGTVTPPSTHDIRRAQLLEQKIEFDFFNPMEGERERILSKGDVNWSTEVGWYVDLQQGNSSYDLGTDPDDPTDDSVTPVTSYTLQGEMVQSDPVIVGDNLVVPTIIPSQDPCSTGGSGWVMSFSKANGGRLRYAPFHTIVGTMPVQGRYVANSMVGTPTYISRQLVVPLGDSSQGEDGVMRMPFQIRGEGRQSWRELR
ncbi:MAG: PilC/PilY family type IV pilus protein [Gammaproteobacteria bacterium]